MCQVYVQSPTFDPNYINEKWFPAIHLGAGTSQCVYTPNSAVTGPCSQARCSTEMPRGDGGVPALRLTPLCHVTNDNLEP